MWMQEALDRLDTSINKIDILDHLAQATSKVKIINFVFFSRKYFYLFLARKY